MPREEQPAHVEWLKRAMRAAIKEYHTYWMAEPSLDIETGLSRYRPAGQGIPPETEATHFTHILQPFAEKHGISVLEFIDQYNDREILEPRCQRVRSRHDLSIREAMRQLGYHRSERVALQG
jgi:alpha,alpha-trehalase